MPIATPQKTTPSAVPSDSLIEQLESSGIFVRILLANLFQQPPHPSANSTPSGRPAEALLRFDELLKALVCVTSSTTDTEPEELFAPLDFPIYSEVAPMIPEGLGYEEAIPKLRFIMLFQRFLQTLSLETRPIEFVLNGDPSKSLNANLRCDARKQKKLRDMILELFKQGLEFQALMDESLQTIAARFNGEDELQKCTEAFQEILNEVTALQEYDVTEHESEMPVDEDGGEQQSLEELTRSLAQETRLIAELETACTLATGNMHKSQRKVADLVNELSSLEQRAEKANVIMRRSEGAESADITALNDKVLSLTRQRDSLVDEDIPRSERVVADWTEKQIAATRCRDALQELKIVIEGQLLPAEVALEHSRVALKAMVEEQTKVSGEESAARSEFERFREEVDCSEAGRRKALQEVETEALAVEEMSNLLPAKLKGLKEELLQIEKQRNEANRARASISTQRRAAEKMFAAKHAALEGYMRTLDDNFNEMQSTFAGFSLKIPALVNSHLNVINTRLATILQSRCTIS